MSAHQWKPGDVAMAVWQGGDFLVVRTFGGKSGDYWSAPKAWPSGVSPYDCEYRTLVVIDPEDAPTVEALAHAWRAAESTDLDNEQPMTSAALRMQAALRSLVTPPKPDEPQGLGAVVEDAGRRWTHFGNGCWIAVVPNAQLDQQSWEAFSTAVRVLSEGWSE